MELSSICQKKFGDKLDAIADRYLFVRYPKDSMGYLFYHSTEQKDFCK